MRLGHWQFRWGCRSGPTILCQVFLSDTAVVSGAIILLGTACGIAGEVNPTQRYFAHPVVEDRYGVIAPWYRGLNGQCDFPGGPASRF
jgi:hypothetical protein